MTVQLMLTPEKVADLLSVSVKTLANWRTQTRAGNKLGPPFVNLNTGQGGARYPDDLLAKWQADEFSKQYPV